MCVELVLVLNLSHRGDVERRHRRAVEGGHEQRAVTAVHDSGAGTHVRHLGGLGIRLSLAAREAAQLRKVFIVLFMLLAVAAVGLSTALRGDLRLHLDALLLLLELHALRCAARTARDGQLDLALAGLVVAVFVLLLDLADLLRHGAAVVRRAGQPGRGCASRVDKNGVRDEQRVRRVLGLLVGQTVETHTHGEHHAGLDRCVVALVQVVRLLADLDAAHEAVRGEDVVGQLGMRSGELGARRCDDRGDGLPGHEVVNDVVEQLHERVVRLLLVRRRVVHERASGVGRVRLVLDAEGDDVDVGDHRAVAVHVHKLPRRTDGVGAGDDHRWVHCNVVVRRCHGLEAFDCVWVLDLRADVLSDSGHGHLLIAGEDFVEVVDDDLLHDDAAEDAGLLHALDCLRVLDGERETDLAGALPDAALAPLRQHSDARLGDIALVELQLALAHEHGLEYTKNSL
eukprot:PhM_4_TR13805/c0_g1_i1/m.70679